MARTILITAGTPRVTSANTTQYTSVGVSHLDSFSTTESLRHTIFRTAGKTSQLFVRITANTIAGNSTIKLRNNASDTTQSVTIPSTATGVFEDTTNEVTIASGDLLAYQTVPGAATNTMTVSLLAVAFDANTNTVSRLVAGSNLSLPTASVSRYNALSGTLSSTISAESTAKTRIRKACSAKNLGFNVSANARTTDTIVRSRKNGANGNLSLTVGATATGWFEDISNTDTLAAGDDYNSVIETGTGTETIVGRALCIDLQTTSAQGTLVVARGAGLAQSPSVTNYLAIGGDLVANSVESDVKLKARDIYTFSELSILVSANTVTASSTLKLRKNGADTSLVVTINASTTGLISDSTNTEAVTAADDVNLALTTGGTGTALTARAITLHSLGSTKITKTASDSITIGAGSIAKIKASPKALIETETIGGTVARINAALKTMATQSITIGDGVVRAVTHAAGVIAKALSQSTVISETRARLKAVWRYQP